jgi:hypothetical protein
MLCNSTHFGRGSRERKALSQIRLSRGDAPATVDGRIGDPAGAGARAGEAAIKSPKAS